MAEQDSPQIPQTKSPKLKKDTPLLDREVQGAEIKTEVQEEINKPLGKSGVVGEENRKFLEMVVQKVENGEIDLFNPATLLNHEVYDKLSEEEKGKVDLNAFNVLADIRGIKGLWDAGHRDTYQIQNLAHHIRVAKERFEAIQGDVFII